jgi:hypothetical protein
MTVKSKKDESAPSSSSKGTLDSEGETGGGDTKENSRTYLVTKNTILAEMKTLAKYDRKVLEMGSKAFMSFLKVQHSPTLCFRPPSFLHLLALSSPSRLSLSSPSSTLTIHSFLSLLSIFLFLPILFYTILSEDTPFRSILFTSFVFILLCCLGFFITIYHVCTI